ncbi:MAG: diaminopimelate epimerase [Bdellovibrionales bacterium]
MILISKLTATGNDFLLVGLHTPQAAAEWPAHFKGRTRAEVTRQLCDRHEGIGADGMLFFTDSGDADFAWDFYNQDGSSAEMCGNAARCAGLWAARTCGGWRDFRFETAAGLVGVRRLDNGMIEVLMPKVTLKKENLEVKLSTGRTKVMWVDSGVPHAVIRQESLKEREVLRSEARELRHHNEFGAAGANVTFYVEHDGQKISTLTFERGVEDFTRACGTGAVAAAYVQHLKSKANQIHVQVPGGLLTVDLSEARPRLAGPAHWVADCQVDTSADGVLPK